MNVTKQIRFPDNVFTSLKAKAKGEPLSQIFTAEMKEYIAGKKVLIKPEPEPSHVHRSSLYLDSDLIEGLKELAKKHGVSFDRAMVLIAENLVGEVQHHTGAGKPLPDNTAKPILRLKDLASILSDHPSIPLVDHQNFPQKAIAGQASTDEITEYLIAKHIEEARANAAKKPYSSEEREMAIEALMNKHHQCNSSHKLEVRDASLLDLDHAA